MKVINVFEHNLRLFEVDAEQPPEKVSEDAKLKIVHLLEGAK